MGGHPKAMAPFAPNDAARLRAMSGRELEKWISQRPALDGLFGMSNVDYTDELAVCALKSLLTGNAAAGQRPTLHRNSKYLGAFQRFKLTVWCVDIGLPCCSMLSILGYNDLLGVPGTDEEKGRRADIVGIYGRGGIQPFRRAQPPQGTLAFVDPCLALVWAEAGIFVKPGVVSAHIFSRHARAYSIWSMQSAATALLQLKSEAEGPRVKIVPLDEDEWRQ